jgi:hypothetical protein
LPTAREDHIWFDRRTAGNKLSPRSRAPLAGGWRRRVPAGRRRRSWQRQKRLKWRHFIPALTNYPSLLEFPCLWTPGSPQNPHRCLPNRCWLAPLGSSAFCSFFDAQDSGPMSPHGRVFRQRSWTRIGMRTNAPSEQSGAGPASNGMDSCPNASAE